MLANAVTLTGLICLFMDEFPSLIICICMCFCGLFIGQSVIVGLKGLSNNASPCGICS